MPGSPLCTPERAAGAPDFCCPRCAVALLPVDGQRSRCERCSRVYERLGDVWCLVPEPPLWRALWKSRLDEYQVRTQLQIDQLASPGERHHAASETTLRRIRRVRAGLMSQLDSIGEYLRVLDAATPRVPLPLPSMSGPAAVLKCYENLFRDWSWGESEAEQSFALVERLAPDELGRLAVYGAGAGRLAVDVHTRLAPRATVALDLNPLPLLVAARLIRGEPVSLPEFPVGPHSEEEVVVAQELRCPSAVGPGLTLAFADSLCPPFAAESLDTVLTSWVIDALDADLHDTARAIAGVLRRGGTWLNMGPLRFDRSWAESYGIGEVHEIVAGAGFEVTLSFRDCIDYFKSPHSGSLRRETVYCFAARKIVSAGPLRTTGVYPPWLSNPDEPIPLTASTLALRRSSVFTNGILSLVDGRRSLRDIAGHLSASWQVDPESLVDPLRAFLARFPVE
jgi:hypothetical protein